jgi:hypothetical protein
MLRVESRPSPQGLKPAKNGGREKFNYARCAMNAVEIEEAISDLALQPFDAAEFSFEFLAAFGNKDTALKRLRTGNNNASDVPGGVTPAQQYPYCRMRRWHRG